MLCLRLARPEFVRLTRPESARLARPLFALRGWLGLSMVCKEGWQGLCMLCEAGQAFDCESDVAGGGRGTTILFCLFARRGTLPSDFV